MKKVIGKVTEDERDEIQSIYGRRNGLNELAKILTADNEELYNRLVTDLGEVTLKFQEWWSATSEKYAWPRAEDGHWEIDFNTCRIYLVTPE